MLNMMGTLEATQIPSGAMVLMFIVVKHCSSFFRLIVAICLLIVVTSSHRH